MNFSKIKICPELESLYSDDIVLYSNNTEQKINVIFYKTDFVGLREKWKFVSSAVSMCYQASISNENEYEKWNLYIIYLCREEVGKELKSKIENDKYSSRKIVEDSQTNEFSTKLANSLIVKYITHSDLIDIVDRTSESKENIYSPKNKSIWNLVKDESILNNTELQNGIIDKLKAVEYED